VMYLDAPWRPEALRWLRRARVVRERMNRTFELSGTKPWMRLVLDPSTPPDEEHTLRMDPTSGVVMAADYRAGSITDPKDLMGVLVHQVLSLGHSRATYEPKHWVLDGYSRFLAEHGDESPGAARPTAAPVFLLGLVAAEQVGPLRKAFEAWDHTTERVGEPAAAALAYVALRALERWQGPSSVLRLARATLEHPGHGDVRDWWHDRREPIGMTFEETTGLRYAVFFERLGEWIAQQRAAAQASSLSWRGGAAEFRAAPDGGGLHVRARLDPPPYHELVCTLRHTAIAVYDRAISRGDLKREEYLWPAGNREVAVTLGGEYGSGERVLLAFDCAGLDLPGTVRLGAARLAVP
jgi:hypothetical protein